MIHSFSCKNFYSFNNFVTVNFNVNEKAPENYGYFLTPSGVRLSKVETVIGPNASGKTNLLKVLPFMKWLIVGSFNLNPEAPLPVKSFIFGGQENKPIDLSVDFEIDSNIYTYSFVLNEKKIISEELRVKNKTNQKITSKKIFSRQWNDKAKKYELIDKNFNLPNGFENLIRSNASIVSVAFRLNHNNSREIYNYWKKVKTNVDEAGWVGDRLLSSFNRQFLDVLDFYGKPKNKNIKEKAEKLLSCFDFGAESFEVKKAKTENGFSISARMFHFFSNQTKYLSMEYESSGTKQLLILLKTILLVLENGGIAVLDELDSNLHPEIILSLLELFINPETNPNNAQLFFSIHSHRILNKLDKYQIVLTEKNNCKIYCWSIWSYA